MKIPLTELIERLHRATGDADTAQLMEAAANRLQDLDIECATLRHGLRLANRRADEAADRLRAAKGETCQICTEALSIVRANACTSAQGERQPEATIAQAKVLLLKWVGGDVGDSGYMTAMRRLLDNA